MTDENPGARKKVPGVTDDQFTEEILESEARKAWELYQSGVLRELYFSADNHEAVLVLECESVDEARRQLAELPLMRAGLIDFQVISLVAYPGFARLFGDLSQGTKQRGGDLEPWRPDDLDSARKVWDSLTPQAKQIYVLLFESEGGMIADELATKLNIGVNKVLGAFGAPALLCKGHNRERIERELSDGRWFIRPEIKEVFRQIIHDRATPNVEGDPNNMPTRMLDRCPYCGQAWDNGSFRRRSSKMVHEVVLFAGVTDLP